MATASEGRLFAERLRALINEVEEAGFTIDIDDSDVDLIGPDGYIDTIAHVNTENTEW